MQYKFLLIFLVLTTFYSVGRAQPTKSILVDNKKLINESILSETENAYNPIPNKDGTIIAYVRTGWGRGFTSGFGRSHLISDVMLMDNNGKILSEKPLANSFLADWTSDGKNLICFRDWRYSIVSKEGKEIKKTSRVDEIREDHSNSIAERASYLSDINGFIWTDKSSIKSTEEVISSNFANSQFLIPSPNGRYIAAAGYELKVYDREKKNWTNLGKLQIHPDKEWDYIKPSWNPWFSDSSKLAFVSDNGIKISSPDGKVVKILKLNTDNTGLAVPSPDGTKIAFATFDPRPMKRREDLSFYGGSVIWLADLDGTGKTVAVSNKSEDETYCLRWLNNTELVFDRIADEIFYKKARLWKATVLKQL